MFSKPEKRLIDENYFDIIRETEDYVEIKSKNTDHCWILQKHHTDKKGKMYIFHKHYFNDKYYHQHNKVVTVRQAINEIKRHDEYVLKCVDR